MDSMAVGEGVAKGIDEELCAESADHSGRYGDLVIRGMCR